MKEGLKDGAFCPPPRLLTGVREGAGCSCLPGQITASAGPGVHCVPEWVVQCRAELGSSLSCWSPPGCSSWGAGGGQRGQPGLGLGWGSGLDMPAPLRVTRLTLSRACSVPAVAQMCPGAQPHLTRARPPQAHSWEATDEEVFFQRF